MAWGKKDDELPERLRGKTPEAIAAELAELDGLKSKNTELETKLTEQGSKFEAFGATVTELTNKVTELSGKVGTPARRANAEGGAEGDGEHQPASFLTDPDRAFAEHAAPLIGVVLSTSARLAREEALKKAQTRQRTEKNNIDGLIFEKYSKEIDDFAKSCTPQQLAQPDTWEHLFFNVKGRHGDEIASQNREGKGEFFVESAQRREAEAEGDRTKLTPMEEKLAKRMGVTPEEYLKQKSSMGTGIPEELLVK